MNGSASAVERAQAYYDSTDADEFYYRIWGGEDIHIGIYDPPDSAVRNASQRTVARMASLATIGTSTRVLDIGAGYGGAARYLSRQFGCHVTCLNLSETQNQRNREQTAAEQLRDHVDIVHGNFEDLPFDKDSYDLVWSQDALLHSGNRPKVLNEVARVLRSGGQFLFADPMQADDCPAGVLSAVLERIHLENLASFAFYRDELGTRGFSELQVLDLTLHLGRHYGRVREELTARYDEMLRYVSRSYADRMLDGLGRWVTAQKEGYLAWGILQFRAP